MKKNIFVIGDLMIDHDVFVTASEGATEGVGDESVYVVSRRRDTAGGAANSARALAVVNEGKTYLWGIMGRSHWGTFRSILERSHAVDGATRTVELRGIQDETDAPMDTTTRLILPSGPNGDRVERRVRFNDVGHLHVTDGKRGALLHHLRRVHSDKDALDAIVVNDFGRKCVTKELLHEVAAFAAEQTIPLFIDPHLDRSERSDRSKYLGIRATAILPNLIEWCHLIGDRDGYSRWRAGLDNERTLIEMAQRSFHFFDQIEIHIIKCDKDGAVLLLPHPKKKHYYAIYRVKPRPGQDLGGDQIGSGDVLSGVFAGEFDRGDRTTASVLEAHRRAAAVVAAYRDAGWHRMPSLAAIAAHEAADGTKQPGIAAEISKGVLFLPKIPVVDMRPAKTAIAGLYSIDNQFREIVERLVKTIRDGWDAVGLRSVVVGAPPGTGKSRIIKAVRELAEAAGVKVVDLTAKLGQMDPENVNQFWGELDAQRDRRQNLLLIVDEAWKNAEKRLLKTSGVNMLNTAHDRHARFMLVSAEFTPDLEKDQNELFGRCDCHYLPGLAERLPDIPFIVAASLYDSLNDVSESRLKIEAGFLLAVTDYTLEKPDVRRLCSAVDEAFKAASVRREAGEDLLVQSRDSGKAAPYARHRGTISDGVFEFTR